MSKNNDSLIEKLESAHASLFNNNAVESAYCSGFGAALSIVREYKPSEIPEDTNKLCEAQNAYLRAMEPVSVSLEKQLCDLLHKAPSKEIWDQIAATLSFVRTGESHVD